MNLRRFIGSSVQDGRLIWYGRFIPEELEVVYKAVFVYLWCTPAELVSLSFTVSSRGSFMKKEYSRRSVMTSLAAGSAGLLLHQHLAYAELLVPEAAGPAGTAAKGPVGMEVTITAITD